MKIILNLLIGLMLVFTNCSDTVKNEEPTLMDKKNTEYEQSMVEPEYFIFNTTKDSIQIEKYFRDAKKQYGLDGLKRMRYIAKLTEVCNNCLKRKPSVVEFKFESGNELIEIKLVEEVNTTLISCINKFVESEGSDELKQQNEGIISIELSSYEYDYFKMLWNKRLLKEDIE